MKKFIVIFMTLAVMMSCLSLSAFAASQHAEATLSIDNVIVSSQSVRAGTTFDVSFMLNTNAPVYWGTGTVTVSGTGFTLSGYLAEQNVSIGRNTISILADSSLTTGRYQVVISADYTYTTTTTTKDKDGESESVSFENHTVSVSRTLNIDIVSDDAEEIIDESKDVAKFRLSAASIPETRGRSNLATTLRLTFENNTGFDAKDVKIRLVNLDDLILNTYTDTVDAGDVTGYHAVSASFPIKFKEFPKAQYTLTAQVTYTSGSGEQLTENYNVYLQATEKKVEEEKPSVGTATLKPKVIVSSFDVDVDNVTSGEEFTLTFKLTNTSEEKDLKNMTVNVDVSNSYISSGSGSTGAVISVVNGTSSFYTAEFPKSSDLEFSIRLKCSASAGAGSYPIGINYSYEYEDNGNYISTSQNSEDNRMTINIPVVQPVKFELMDWYPPEQCSLSGTSISFQYFNKSRNPMSNLAISVEGDFEMATNYVGSLNASSYDYFNGYITPVDGAQVGDSKSAILVFTFEDAAGNEQRVEYPFDVTISEGGMSFDEPGMDFMPGGDWGFDIVEPGMPGFDGMPVDGEGVDGEGSGLSLWVIIAIIAAAAVVVIIAVVVVVKKVKAKREEDEDDE